MASGLSTSHSRVSAHRQEMLEKEAMKNWDKFYLRNGTNFFKDRHWTQREYEELNDNCKKDVVLLEVGCGVGNFLFPLLDSNESIFIYACDFSPRAVDYVKRNPLYNTERCNAFVCDITNDDLEKLVPTDKVNIATLIFVLSAIHPEKMLVSLQNIHKILQPGGAVLFRDYAVNDYAMLRFKETSKLSENFYVRQDGTRAYYFSVALLRTLFVDAGFEEEYCDYVHRNTVNKKEDLCVGRVFVQAKFVKPYS